jgi:hypothetical protein
MNPKDTHPWAGKTVKIKENVPQIGGRDFEIENYWHNERIYGKSWKWAIGNPVALLYAVRKNSGHLGEAIDDEVLYGIVEGHGKMLIHVNEIDPPIEQV